MRVWQATCITKHRMGTQLPDSKVHSANHPAKDHNGCKGIRLQLLQMLLGSLPQNLNIKAQTGRCETAPKGNQRHNPLDPNICWVPYFDKYSFKRVLQTGVILFNIPLNRQKMATLKKDTHTHTRIYMQTRSNGHEPHRLSDALLQDFHRAFHWVPHPV